MHKINAFRNLLHFMHKYTDGLEDGLLSWWINKTEAFTQEASTFRMSNSKQQPGPYKSFLPLFSPKYMKI